MLYQKSIGSTSIRTSIHPQRRLEKCDERWRARQIFQNNISLFFPSENKIFSNTKKHPNAKIVIFSKWRLAAVPRRWPGAALASLQRQENHFRLFFFFVLNQRRGEEEEEEERKAAIKTFFFSLTCQVNRRGNFHFVSAGGSDWYFFPPATPRPSHRGDLLALNAYGEIK